MESTTKSHQVVRNYSHLTYIFIEYSSLKNQENSVALPNILAFCSPSFIFINEKPYSDLLPIIIDFFRGPSVKK